MYAPPAIHPTSRGVGSLVGKACHPLSSILHLKRKDVYVAEKLGTEQGWSKPAPDEDWQHGYPQEFQDFMSSFAARRAPLSSGELARDTIAVLYSAYLSAERRGAEVVLTL